MSKKAPFELMKSRDWAALGWAGAFFSLALLFFQAESSMLRWSDDLVRTGHMAEAVVTSASHGWQSRDDGEPPSIGYEFRIEGRTYSGAAEQYVPLGDTVKIRYSPDNPSVNIIVGDEPQLDLFASLLFVMAGGYFLLMGLSAGTWRLINKDPSCPYEPTSFLRFPVVLLGMLAGYFSLIERLEGDGAKARLAFVWATACFMAYPAVRWKVWPALVFVMILIIAFNPILPVYLGPNPGGWVSGLAGFGLLILAAKVKPSESLA